MLSPSGSLHQRRASSVGRRATNRAWREPLRLPLALLDHTPAMIADAHLKALQVEPAVVVSRRRNPNSWREKRGLLTTDHASYPLRLRPRAPRSRSASAAARPECPRPTRRSTQV